MESIIKKLGKTSITVEKDYHSSEKEYNKLTIVEEEGTFKTYLSRKPVPIGTELTNREYWIPFSGVLESITFDYLKFKKDYASGKAIEDNAIITRHILNRNIERIKIALKAISEEEIDDNAIIERTIKDRNITSNKIAQENILTEHFAKKSVITSILADYIITAIKLADNSVTTRSIANENVTDIKLANNAVTTRSIAQESIIEEKFANNSVSTRSLIDKSITKEKLAENSVTESKIADNNITNRKIANNTIDITKFDSYTRNIIESVRYIPEEFTSLKEAIFDEINKYKPIIINGDVTNAADEEDITSENNLLKLKDRSALNGMGYIILRKNKSFAEQVTKANTIYEIRYDFNLNEGTVILPNNCILLFIGGTISNGLLKGNQTKVVAANYEIFKAGITKYHGYKSEGNYKYVSKTTNGVILSGTWNNINCPVNWTGLVDIQTCSSVAINNFIILHNKGSKITMPANLSLFVYDTIKAENRDIDFSNCTLIIPDYQEIEDLSIPLPQGSESVPLEHPGALIWIGGKNHYIKNLTIDERAEERGEDIYKLGYNFAINEVTDTINFTYENITIKNTVGCGIQELRTSYNITYKNVIFDSIGEHGIYTHTFKGKHIFEDCLFRNCTNSDTAYKLRGNSQSACFRCSHSEQDNEIATLNVYFNRCSFIGDDSAKYNSLTTYRDIPYILFNKCEWIGESMDGYTGRSSNESTYYRIEKREFVDCLNPKPLYGNSYYNTKSILKSCNNVPLDFMKDAEYIENCNFVLSYAEVKVNYIGGFENELDKVLIIKNSSFIGQSLSISSFLNFKSRSKNISMVDCVIDYSGVDSYYPSLLGFGYASNQTNLSLYNCSIKCSHARFAYSPSSSRINLFKMVECDLVESYANFSSISCVDFIMRNCRCLFSDSTGRIIDGVSNSWDISGTINKYPSYDRYYQEYILTQKKDGDVITLDKGFMIPSGTIDLRQYITISPLGGSNTPFSYEIINNGANTNATATIHGPLTPISIRIIIDFRKYKV